MRYWLWSEESNLAEQGHARNRGESVQQCQRGSELKAIH